MAESVLLRKDHLLRKSNREKCWLDDYLEEPGKGRENSREVSRMVLNLPESHGSGEPTHEAGRTSWLFSAVLLTVVPGLVNECYY